MLGFRRNFAPEITNIDFCKSNGSSRQFRIDRIMNRDERYEIQVSPVIA